MCCCVVNFFSAETLVSQTLQYNIVPSVLKISALNSLTYFHNVDEKSGFHFGILLYTRERQTGTKRQLPTKIIDQPTLSGNS